MTVPVEVYQEIEPIPKKMKIEALNHIQIKRDEKFKENIKKDITPNDESMGLINTIFS